MKRRTILAAASAGMGAALWPAVQAQTRTRSFAERTMQMIVPFPAGGGTDVIARALGEKLYPLLGQRMVTLNRSGGLGVIAQNELRAAPPDGHTLLLDSMAVVVFPSLMRVPRYDPIKELAPVALVTSFPFAIVVNADVPIYNVRDLVDQLETRADKINVASAGATTQLAAEMFRLMADVEITLVPYRGGAPTMAALLANESQVYFGDLPTVIPHVRSGRLRAIAVTSMERAPLLPEVPTVAESGIPKYSFRSWNGAYVRAGTPPDIVQALNEAINTALRDPDITKLIRSVGSDPGSDSVSSFASFHANEYSAWKDLIQRANIPMID